MFTVSSTQVVATSTTTSASGRPGEQSSKSPGLLGTGKTLDGCDTISQSGRSGRNPRRSWSCAQFSIWKMTNQNIALVLGSEVGVGFIFEVTQYLKAEY